MELVTIEGETLLTNHDTWGIGELRRQKLIWQSWGPMVALSTQDHQRFPNNVHGSRLVRFTDPRRMRLFLLSLLWRAAASRMAEFDEVDLRSSDLRRLRQAVRDGIVPPPDFFPATLTQISTRGVPHNMGPIVRTKPVVGLPGRGVVNRRTYRFYFDGLIVHFHRNGDSGVVDDLLPMLVGEDNSVLISTVTFENSWQWENFQIVVDEAECDFPGGRARAEGASSNR